VESLATGGMVAATGGVVVISDRLEQLADSIQVRQYRRKNDKRSS
jgi:hypothetical protein